MATVTTLLDIAKANGSDKVVGLIDETSKAHPEISAVAARTIKGISYKTWVRKTLPTVGFRNANEGGTVDTSKYENRTVDCYIFNPRYEVDKAVADSHEDGAAAYLAYEAEGMLEAGMQLLGKQFYYGQSATSTASANDAKGHPGLLQGYSTTYEVNAAGTTASTATSVWAVKFGEKYVQWVYGENGQFNLSDVMIQRVTDANSKPYTAYIQEILARPGLQFGSQRGVGRIKNITDDSGKGLTDSLLAQLIAKFEVGVVPDAIFLNRRARRQLQVSRTVTLFGNSSNKVSGANMTIAPLPTEYDGIPLLVTDSISDTESIV